MQKLTLAGLGAFGIQMDSAIEGLSVTGIKKTNRQNVFQIQMESTDGKVKRHAFVGSKSIEEGLLGEENGVVKVLPGFETYQNQANETWVRNKSRALAKLEVI